MPRTDIPSTRETKRSTKQQQDPDLKIQLFHIFRSSVITDYLSIKNLNIEQNKTNNVL